jgi:ABC-type antimicrobial peptide transport system permease subunit
VGLALVISHNAAEMLFELQGYDPIVLTTSVIVLSSVALLAGLIPAIRASRTDPMRALRYE